MNKPMRKKHPKPAAKPKQKKTSPRPQPPPSRNRSVEISSRSKASSSSFLAALVRPFDPSSLGCQVPDPFPFPTQTYHLHQTLVVGSPAASSITSGALLFLPNPIVSTIDLQHAQGLTSANYVISSTPQQQLNTSATSGGSSVFGAATMNGLKTVFSSYRVVSWGVKVSNLQAELTATGRVMFAMIPIGDTVPTITTLAIATDSSFIPAFTGIPLATLASSAILELPTAFELTVGDLLHGDIQASGMYTNSSFWQFKTSLQSGSAGASIFMGDEIDVVAGGVTGVGYKDPTRCEGGCGLVMYFEGIPAATVNAFQVEVIYHLEGSPQLNSAVNNVPVPSQRPKATIGPVDQVERAMITASKPGNIFSWVKAGALFLDKNKDMIKKIGGMAAALM